MQDTTIELELPIEGMTCASCVNRVERFLRKTEGVVDANVNLATEQATVRFDPIRVGRSELEKAVEDAGYEVRPDTDAGSPEALALTDATDAQVQRQRAEQRGLGIEALIALSVGVAMMALTLWPSPLLPLERLNLLLILPATVVQFWAGRRFYTAAWRAARHRAANMSTLVVLG